MKGTILFAFLALLAPSFAAAQEEAVIPKGTDIFVTLGGALNVKTTRPGDKVFATVAVPVVIDDHIVIPAGSRLVGKVAELRKGAGKKEQGWIGLAFENVIFPSGANRKLEALSTGSEGEIPEGKGANEAGGLRTSISEVALMGVNALVSLFSRKPDQLPQGASLTVQLQRDLRLTQ